MEEILFRGVLQEFLLKRLPQRILHTFAPRRAWIIDSTPLKVMRVLAVSTLFALVHEEVRACERSIGPQLAGGFAFGYQMEVSESLIPAIQQHLMWNNFFLLAAQLIPRGS